MKNIANEVVVSALLSCSSIREAAENVGLSEKAIYNRMKTPEFRELYKQARQNLLDAATGRLQNSANNAISALESVMTDESAGGQTRVNAALGILQFCLKFTENVDLRAQIEELENGVNEPENNDALSASLAELALTLESDNV